MALVSSLCRYYRWPPDFWRRMGRREFYAWVNQVHEETIKSREQNPDSWDNYENDEWYRNAREKRRRGQER